MRSRGYRKPVGLKSIGLGWRRNVDETRRSLVQGNCHSESYVTEGDYKTYCMGRKRGAERSRDTVFLRPTTRASYEKGVQYLS